MAGDESNGARSRPYILEWYEVAQRRRQAGGATPAEALEPTPKRLDSTHASPTSSCRFLTKARTRSCLNPRWPTSSRHPAFRKPLTYQKYEYILELFCEYVSPKATRGRSRRTTSRIPRLEKIKSFDPALRSTRTGSSCTTFFSKLKLDNPVKEVPRFPVFEKAGCVHRLRTQEVFRRVRAWEKAFFALTTRAACGGGELKTLHWSAWTWHEGVSPFCEKAERHSLQRTGKNRSVPPYT